MVDLYWDDKHEKFAVLLSPGYGSGWSTWNVPEIAYDKRIVEWYYAHNSQDFRSKVIQFGLHQKESKEHKEANKFFTECGYPETYFGGFPHVDVRWVAAGALWRIKEYDGAESIEYFDTTLWNQFYYNEGESNEAR